MPSSLNLLLGRSEPSRIKPDRSLGSEETAAAVRVMESGVLSDFIGRAGVKFLGGVEVRGFERQFAERFKVKHAVSFNSATTALQAAVTAAGIGPGDEVITSPYSMSATPTCILLNNAIPVFADIDEDTYCLDPVSVRARITPRTKAILIVNIWGRPAEFDELKALAKEFDLFLIEDNAQSPGGTYKGEYAGTIGDIGVFSLNVHKTIQCGEGGVLVTNDDRLALRAQLARNHGESVLDDLVAQGVSEDMVGSNYRMSELHAAVAAEQLKKLDALNAPRLELAAYLTEGLSKFTWIVPCRVPEYVKHVYYIYPFRILPDAIGLKRETVAAALGAEGYPIVTNNPKPLHLLPVFQKKKMYERTSFPFVSSEFPTDVSYQKGICPVAERLYEREFCYTTIFRPPNTRAEVDGMLDALSRIEKEREALLAYEKTNSGTRG